MSPELAQKWLTYIHVYSKLLNLFILAAEYISWGVEKGAKMTGNLIKAGSEKLRARLSPEDQPKAIDPRVQKGIQYVRVGSHAAVKVSSYIGEFPHHCTQIQSRPT